ncbi:MAG: bifunctional metallophosphatase/5'-nucleotidase, partial [Victivallales bacterium]|nr:bifunctional metallophosphatase/5'-nucleotidase [Victivallales bacterium]
MNIIKRISLLLVWCFLATAEECVVRILHTTDLHANLTGDEIAPTSFAQLATVLHQLRDDFAGPVLHIDTGDTIEGSLAGAIDRGPSILKALKQAGCDIWVPGNHEFDFGTQNFLELAKTCPLTMLCGNLWPRGTPPDERYSTWKMFSCGKARIAVIGLTASYLPNWYLDDFHEAFEVETAVVTLKRILPDILKEKPDAIILGIHQGLANPQSDPRGVNEVTALARLFPEIDLILGGHTHRAIPGRRTSHSWYLQPAAHGEFIGLAELTIDLAAHHVTQISSRLVQPVLDTPHDQLVMETLSGIITEAAVIEAKVLHAPLKTEVSSKGQPGISCPISELICTALAEATDAEVALHGTLSTIGLPATKELTIGDLFTVIPYENTAVTAEITAEELAQIVAEQWSQRKVYTYSGIWGADVVIDSSGVAHITGIGKNHEVPLSGCRYRLVLNSHTAAGGGRNPILHRILANPVAKCTNT